MRFYFYIQQVLRRFGSGENELRSPVTKDELVAEVWFCCSLSIFLVFWLSFAFGHIVFELPIFWMEILKCSKSPRGNQCLEVCLGELYAKIPFHKKFVDRLNTFGLVLMMLGVIGYFQSLS